MRLKFYILSDLLIKKDCNIIKYLKLIIKKNIVNFYFLIHKIFLNKIKLK